MRNRLMMIMMSLVIGISCVFAQNSTADRLYNEGIKLQNNMTVTAQNAAIQKFISAKKLYDSAANKQKCDHAIAISKNIIKSLGPINNNSTGSGGNSSGGGGYSHGNSGSGSDGNSGGYSGGRSQPQLDYATWNGGWKNGVPHGTGTMTFTAEHLIDSRDPKQRVAQAGESVTGEWSDGHLVMGRWTKSDGTKESIIIGRAD